jgi:hypothetical protein
MAMKYNVKSIGFIVLLPLIFTFVCCGGGNSNGGDSNNGGFLSDSVLIIYIKDNVSYAPIYEADVCINTLDGEEQCDKTDIEGKIIFAITRRFESEYWPVDGTITVSKEPLYNSVIQDFTADALIIYDVYIFLTQL